MKRPARNIIFTSVLALLPLNPLATLAQQGVIERIIAPASDQFPRNSEGDIVVLNDGSLLAAWSEFYGGARDDSKAKISARRSKDGGRSWGSKFTLRENSGKLNVMSVSFLRLDSGELLLFYLKKNSRSDLDVMAVRSADDGKTWSSPVLVTADEGYFVMNNSRVVQLRSGRIVAPTSHTREVWKRGNTFKTVCFYSDDRGESWIRGKGECSAPGRGAMEPGLIEKKNGTVLQIIRTQTGKLWFAESKDGCDTWTSASPWNVVSPEAPATLAKLPGSGDWLIVYNPTVNPRDSHNGERTPLVAALSKNEGQSWSEPKPVEADLRNTYSYASIDFLRDRVLLSYYVRPGKNAASGPGRISWKFKSLPRAWFTR